MISGDEQVALLNKMMRDIKEQLPETHGATLLLFPYKADGGLTSYISSAERQDMCTTMQFLLDSWVERGYYNRDATPRESQYIELLAEIARTPNNLKLGKIKGMILRKLEQIK